MYSQTNMNEISEKAKNIPTIKETNSLATLSLEEKIDKVLSIFESIDEVGKYTLVKLKGNVVLCSEDDLAIASGKSVIIKTVEGGLYLN